MEIYVDKRPENNSSIFIEFVYNFDGSVSFYPKFALDVWTFGLGISGLFGFFFIAKIIAIQKQKSQ